MRISNYFWYKLRVAVVCERIGVAVELNFMNVPQEKKTTTILYSVEFFIVKEKNKKLDSICEPWQKSSNLKNGQ